MPSATEHAASIGPVPGDVGHHGAAAVPAKRSSQIVQSQPPDPPWGRTATRSLARCSLRCSPRRSSSRRKSAISAVTTWRTSWAARGGGGSSSDDRSTQGTRTARGFCWRWPGCRPSGRPTRRLSSASVLLEDRPDVRACAQPRRGDEVPGQPRYARASASDSARSAGGSGKPAPMRKAMLDANGMLNPGMMPRTLDDLALIAPPRDTLDAHRVSLWNRVAEVWRQEDNFRQAVLRYATRSDHLDTVEHRALARSRLPPDRACPLAA